MIQSNGRYANSTVVTIDVNGQPRQVITPSPAIPYTFQYQPHVWTGADRLDLMAYRMYGDQTKWWAIGAGNPEIMDWTQIQPGIVNRIPNL